MNEKNTKPFMRSSRTIQDFDRLRKECLFRGCLFEDPDFPAENSCLWFQYPITENDVKWIRPTEIVKDPQFFVSDSSRFDVCQGALGDCWILASMATLTLHPNLFYQVVPADQDFKENYAGIFHFRFWQCGEWVDIVIDDRLPIQRGRLLYTSSSAKNEFWSALLEKAYAKLRGSYKALHTGCTQEALEVFTSGITESYDLKKSPQNLYDILLKSYEMGSLICCSISKGYKEVEARNLFTKHAYSITKVTYLKTNEGRIPLMRIRNPWGNDIEWTGDWSDRSSKWDSVSDFEKKRLGLTVKGDGEFWISFADFEEYFTQVVICHMDRNSLGESYRPIGKKWEIAGFRGEWESRLTYYKDSGILSRLPQYRITLKHSNEIDGECSVIISLMQKMSRIQKEKRDKLKLVIGFFIFDLRNLEKLPKRLDRTFFESNKHIHQSSLNPSLHVISGRFKLSPGTYCIVPFTYNEKGQFLLRVISENEFHLEDCNYRTGVRPIYRTNRKTEFDLNSESETSDEIVRAFSKL